MSCDHEMVILFGDSTEAHRGHEREAQDAHRNDAGRAEAHVN